MNKRISLYKKISIFRSYKKTLRSIRTELEQVFGARIDNAWRIYNVINIPEDIVGEPYNLRKTDIDMIAERSIKEYTSELSKFLNNKGLQELYDFYEVKKVDRYSYLVVLGFSLFRSNDYYDVIRYRVLPTISIISIILLLILFL
jgi:hypothetical protein